MLVLFYLVLNTYAYNWTGQLYPAGSGFNLATPAGFGDSVCSPNGRILRFPVLSLSLLLWFILALLNTKKATRLGYRLL